MKFILEFKSFYNVLNFEQKIVRAYSEIELAMIHLISDNESFLEFSCLNDVLLTRHLRSVVTAL